MRQRLLGNSGTAVSDLALGTMTFGAESDEATSHAMLDAYAAAGGTLIDTADVYSEWADERIVGRWLAANTDAADRMVVATKGRFPMGEGPNDVGLSRRHLRRALAASLERLGTDHVDLYQFHAWDPLTPVEELAGTMQRLVEEGKILGYGLSEVAPYTLRRAHAVHPVTAVQNEYSLWTRQPELGLIQTCAELGVAFVPFSPLARGCFGTPMADPAATGVSALWCR